jgi:hypothetical protein
MARDRRITSWRSSDVSKEVKEAARIEKSKLRPREEEEAVSCSESRSFADYDKDGPLLRVSGKVTASRDDSNNQSRATRPVPDALASGGGLDTPDSSAFEIIAIPGGPLISRARALPELEQVLADLTEEIIDLKASNAQAWEKVEVLRIENANLRGMLTKALGRSEVS